MQKQMTVSEASELYDDQGLPDGFGLRVVGGRTTYKYIGFMWRQSPNTIYVSNAHLFDLGEEKKRRYLPDNTVVELVTL
jgi:hypothetical protein